MLSSRLACSGFNHQNRKPYSVFPAMEPRVSGGDWGAQVSGLAGWSGGRRPGLFPTWIRMDPMGSLFSWTFCMAEASSRYASERRPPSPRQRRARPAHSTGGAEGGCAGPPAPPRPSAPPRPERAPGASPPRAGRGGAAQGGSAAGAEPAAPQPWLPGFPARWSPAAPPPSPGISWCNVSNRAPGLGCKARFGATGPGPASSPWPSWALGSGSSAGVCA